MISRLALLAVAVSLGCSKADPKAAVPTDDPSLIAAGEGAIDQEGVAWIKRANDEAERLQQEQDAIAGAGLTPWYSPAGKAYSTLFNEYAGGSDDDWAAAARRFVERVQGKRLPDFDPDPEKTAARLLEHAEALAAAGNQDEAQKYYKLAAEDFPATKAGKAARGL